MFDPSSPFLAPGHPLHPVQKTNFAEDRLKAAVQLCELEPGSVATEAEIAERFGIGRAGVRVALARLSALGLVHPIPRAGWKVLPMTGRLIGDVIDARRLAEPGLAIARPDAAGLRRIEELAEMIGFVADQPDAGSLATRRGYERELLTILAAATNPLVAQFLSSLWDHSDRILRYLERGTALPFRALDAGTLARAVAQGDGAGVAALRLQDIQDFERFAGSALLRDRTELGPLTGAATAIPPSTGADKPEGTADNGIPQQQEAGQTTNTGDDQ